MHVISVSHTVSASSPGCSVQFGSTDLDAQAGFPDTGRAEGAHPGAGPAQGECPAVPAPDSYSAKLSMSTC